MEILILGRVKRDTVLATLHVSLISKQKLNVEQQSVQTHAGEQRKAM